VPSVDSQAVTAPATADAVSIDLGGRLVYRLLLGAAGLIAVGLLLLVGATSGELRVEGGSAAVAIAASIGGLLVLFGFLCLYGAYRGVGVRLVIDAGGIAREGRSRTWRIAWDDLDAAGVSVLRWMPPRATNPVGRGERMGRIVLAPARDLGALYGVRQGDEPEPWTHYVTLGANADWVAAAEQGLERFAGERYRGAQERDVLRRRYS
jgi:hypothetical protein